MKHDIDIIHWKRQSHFHFFVNFDDPLFGITANIDCTAAYHYARKAEYSFYLYYLHKSLLAVNSIENFRYRIENKQPVLYDAIHASTTILKDDETCSFVFLPYHCDFEQFYHQAQQRIEVAKQIRGLDPNAENARQDVIHYSAIPWVSFTSITHERSFQQPSEGIPKITFGKYFWQDSRLMIPVAVYGHHGLMDGLHIGQYYETFEALLNTTMI